MDFGSKAMRNVYAVSGVVASNNSEFPTTIKKASKILYWPLVKEALARGRDLREVPRLQGVGGRPQTYR